MSWISNNYEKAALAGALVTALALGYMGLQRTNSVPMDFDSVAKGRGSNDPSVIDADKVATAKSSWEIGQHWVQADDDGLPVDLFTGVPLFLKKMSGDQNQIHALHLPKSADVHPPIPNQWWLDYRIDPGFGDSPQRDEDGDGFSNLEEYNAKTNPSDNRSHPPLILKLVYIKDDSISWALRPSGYPTPEDTSVNFEYSDSRKIRERTPASAPMEKGGILFTDADSKAPIGRFKYVDFETKREFSQAIQADIEVTTIRIEDLKPNKQGTIYEIPANFSIARELKKYTNHDRTAILSLEAIGNNGIEFRVEEFTDFSLPFGNEPKRYHMMEITPLSIKVRETLEDGSTVIHEIPKKL